MNDSSGVAIWSVRPANPADAGALIALEAAAFGARSWGGASMAEGLSTKGVEGLIAHSSVPGSNRLGGAQSDGVAVGFALWRVLGRVAEKRKGSPAKSHDGMDAEILTIGVAPAERRGGVGWALLQTIIANASMMGVETLFLEVAEDNHPAIKLYESANFGHIGRRDHYYPDGCAALVMKLPIT